MELKVTSKLGRTLLMIWSNEAKRPYDDARTSGGDLCWLECDCCVTDLWLSVLAARCIGLKQVAVPAPMYAVACGSDFQQEHLPST